MTGDGDRVELRLRGRLTARTASAFRDLHVSAGVETTVVVRTADDGAGSLLRALDALGADVLGIRALADPGTDARQVAGSLDEQADGSPAR